MKQQSGGGPSLPFAWEGVMEAQHYDSANEFHRLRVAVAESRAQAIRSQIAVGFTFCRIAETERAYGHHERVHAILDSCANWLRRYANT